MNKLFDLSGKRVWIAGHKGMVGSAILRQLNNGRCTILTANGIDLRVQSDVELFVAESLPDVIFVAAAKVGGIVANATYPADFIYDNLAIETNIIHAAHNAGVKKLVFLGSTCVYPRDAEQPIKEEALLSGPLEPTNEWYAIAKIAGIKLCQAYRRQYGDDFISAMPTNLYGPHDNFDLNNSHVLPAMIRKFHDAYMNNSPKITLWGSGSPRREFMHVDDAAAALVFLAENYSDSLHINVGTGEDIALNELAWLVAEVVGYKGTIEFDRAKPDGTPRKLTDISRLKALGYDYKISLGRGICTTYDWFLHSGEAKL
jgi:GDP-L-fucose synthase